MPLLLLLTLAATPEVQFEPAGGVGLALGVTYRARVASGPVMSLVVWESGGRIGIRAGSVHAARFDPANLGLDPEGILISAPLGSNPAVAWQNDLGVWVVVYEFENEVFLRLVRTDGTFHQSTLAPRRLGIGRAPKVASVSMGYVVTAEDVQPVLWRFALPTTQLDPSGLRFGSGPLAWGSTVGITASQPTVTSMVWQSQQALSASTLAFLGTSASMPMGFAGGGPRARRRRVVLGRAGRQHPVHRRRWRDGAAARRPLARWCDLPAPTSTGRRSVGDVGDGGSAG